MGCVVLCLHVTNSNRNGYYTQHDVLIYITFLCYYNIGKDDTTDVCC